MRIVTLRIVPVLSETSRPVQDIQAIVYDTPAQWEAGFKNVSKEEATLPILFKFDVGGTHLLTMDEVAFDLDCHSIVEGVAAQHYKMKPNGGRYLTIPCRQLLEVPSHLGLFIDNGDRVIEREFLN